MGSESQIDIDALIGPASVADPIREADLADLLGLSTRSIRELAQRGIIHKCGPGRYAKRDSVRAYCAHMREQAAARSTSGTLTAERIRVAREQADALAFKNAALRGEFVPTREVISAWSTILRDVRAAMLAIPSRIQQQLGTLTAHDIDVIDREIRTALEETAK